MNTEYIHNALRCLAVALVAGLAGWLAPSTGSAESVPQEYLDGDYQNCMSQSEGTAYSQDQRDRYCRCTVAEFAKLDVSAYLVMTGEVLDNAPSAETTAYLGNVHAACEGQLSQ